MCILLVENHEDTANYLRIYLEELGHTVSVAGTLAEARSLSQKSAFDLIFCDIALPDGSGWDLMATLDASSVFAVAMSGFGAESDREKSLRSGFRHHLTKPFLPDEFDRILNQAISGHRDLAGAPD